VTVRRGALAAAALLLLLAVALPWGIRYQSNAVYNVGMPDLSYVEGEPVITYGTPYFSFEPDNRPLHGREHEMRIIGAVAALLVVAAVRRHDRRLAKVALAVAVLAIPIGLSGDFGVGRLVYALAIVAAAVGTGALSSSRPPAPSTST